MRGVPRERRAISAGALGLQFDIQHLGGPADNLDDVLHLIEVQPEHQAEAVPQGRGEQAGPGGGPHQGEMGQFQLHGAGPGPLADDQVQVEVLHGRVENLLHHRGQAVHFVDEQDVPGLKVGEQGRQVPGPLHHRPGGSLDTGPHLLGDDMGQGGLPQARGAVHQDVIHRLPPGQGRGQGDFQVAAQFLLPHKLRQGAGPQPRLQTQVFHLGPGVDDALFLVHWP